MNKRHHLQENGAAASYTSYRGRRSKVKTNLICHVTSQSLEVV